MRVKICGITSPADAIIAEEAGADMIGVIACSPSPRCVEPAVIREIFDAVPSLTRVCVAHEPSPAQLEVICALKPDAIQVPPAIRIPETCRARLFRSVRPGDPVPARADALVIDASQGSGRKYDRDFAIAVVREAEIPVFLAGGLNPDNVAEAIRAVDPAGVDVATGVESAPGKKERSLVEAFVSRAKGAGR